MAEYISREAVNDLIEDMRNNHFILMSERVNLALLKSKVAEIPVAAVQPVKHGRWIDVYTWTMFHEFKSSGRGEHFWCSECEQGQKQKSNYCPNCGADMRSDAE